MAICSDRPLAVAAGVASADHPNMLARTIVGAIAEIAVTEVSSDTELRCLLFRLRLRRRDFGLVAFGQVHRMDAGLFRQLL